MVVACLTYTPEPSTSMTLAVSKCVHFPGCVLTSLSCFVCARGLQPMVKCWWILIGSPKRKGLGFFGKFPDSNPKPTGTRLPPSRLPFVETIGTLSFPHLPETEILIGFPRRTPSTLAEFSCFPKKNGILLSSPTLLALSFPSLVVFFGLLSDSP